MFTAILLVALGALYTLYSYLSNRKYRLKLSKIKSEPALPILGHVFKLGSNSEELLPSLQRMWTNLGQDKFLLKIGTIEQVVLTKPEDIEVILSNFRLIEKNIIYKNAKALIGDSVFVCAGAKWRQMRKFQTPAFSFSVLESYMGILDEEARFLMNELMAKPGEDIDVYPIFYNRALVTICRAGIGFNIITDVGFVQYINSMYETVALVGKRMFSSWKSIDFLYNLTADGKEFKRHLKYVHDKNRTVLEIRKEEMKLLLEEVNSGRQSLESITIDMSQKTVSFLDLLLLGRKENGEPLTNDEIIDEVHTFTIAGHETTSTSSAFAVYNLAMHPNVQLKAFQEQLIITEGDLNKPITYKDLQNMRYLECVIKESMRLYSAVVFFGRLITEDVVLPDGTELPIGCNVMFMPHLTHRHPEVYPDPEEFNPNRFLENPPSPYMYFPFSSGPRNCIGKKLAMMEMKFWLATIVRSLELFPPKGKHPRLAVEVVLKSATGVNVSWRKRQS